MVHYDSNEVFEFFDCHFESTEIAVRVSAIGQRLFPNLNPVIVTVFLQI